MQHVAHRKSDEVHMDAMEKKRELLQELDQAVRAYTQMAVDAITHNHNYNQLARMRDLLEKCQKFIKAA